MKCEDFYFLLIVIKNMTCFWDSLRNKLNINDTNREFILYLKKSNTKNISVNWNSSELTEKQLDENFEHIKNFDENKINDGYDCSICDPFLILVCELYNINIFHNFNGYEMKYIKDDSYKNINCRSNTSHFS